MTALLHDLLAYSADRTPEVRALKFRTTDVSYAVLATLERGGRRSRQDRGQRLGREGQQEWPTK